MRRYLVNRAIPLTFTLYPVGSETAGNADGAGNGVVNVSVTHANGTTLLASTQMTGAGAGVYTYTMAPIATVAKATITYTYNLSGVANTEVAPLEVVTSFAADLAEIRALDGIAGQSTQYPTSLLVAAREQAETMFEQSTGTAWSKQYQRDLLDGDPTLRRAMSNTDYIWLPYPTRRLILSRRNPRSLLNVYLNDGTSRTVTDGVTTLNSTTVTSATAAFTPGDVGGFITGAGIASGAVIAAVNSATSVTMSAASTTTATGVTLAIVGGVPSVYDSGNLLYPSGEMERQLGQISFPRGLENVAVEYVHGLDYMPSDLKRAFLVYIRYLVLYTTFRVPDRATMETSDAGTFLLGMAQGFNKPTGLPEVDAVLQRYGVRESIIA